MLAQFCVVMGFVRAMLLFLVLRANSWQVEVARPCLCKFHDAFYLDIVVY